MIKKEEREIKGGFIDHLGNSHYFNFSSKRIKIIMQWSLCVKKIWLPLSPEVDYVLLSNTTTLMNLNEFIENNPDCELLFGDGTDSGTYANFINFFEIRKSVAWNFREAEIALIKLPKKKNT